MLVATIAELGSSFQDLAGLLKLYGFPYTLPLLLAFFILSVPLVLWEVSGRFLKGLVSPLGLNLLSGFCALFLLAGVGYFIWYASVETFVDHLEPAISSISWLVFKEGYPLYHALEAPERYSILYGPMLFIINGLSLLWFGPSITAAKLSSVLAGAGSVLCLLGLFRSRAGFRIGLVYTAFVLMNILCFKEVAFRSKGDPLILFTVSLGLFCAAVWRPKWACIGVSLLLGLAINLKVHAGIYFLPLLVWLGSRAGARPLIGVVAGAVGVAVVPFLLFPQISLAHYIIWLRAAVAHGIDSELLAVNAQYGVLLLIPLVSLFFIPWDLTTRLARAEGAYALALVCTVALLITPASKFGAGPHHFVPMYGLVGFLAVRGMAQINLATAPRRLVVAALIACVLTTGTLMVPHQIYRIRRLFHWSGYPIHQDIQRILETYPEQRIAMGCSGPGQYWPTWFRAPIAYAGHPYLIDVGALMEMDQAGLTLPPATLNALREGKIRLWLIPRGGEPFSLRNAYAPHPPLFNKEFRQLFFQHYTRRGQSTFFDLWFYTPSVPEVNA